MNTSNLNSPSCSDHKTRYKNPTGTLNNSSDALTARQNAEKTEPSYGPYRVDKPPTMTPIQLSQAEGETTGRVSDMFTATMSTITAGIQKMEPALKLKSAPIGENAGAFSSDNDNFKKDEKFPVEFIREITESLKTVSALTGSSDSKIDKNSLKRLLTPEEVKDENDSNFNESVIINQDTVIRGIPLPNMKAHSLKPGTEPEVKTIYSYSKDELDWDEIRIAFGLLKSGDPFHFRYRFDNSCMELIHSYLFIAPDWNSLIDHLIDYDLNTLVINMSKSNSDLLADWLEFRPLINIDTIRDKLKIVLNSDLLDKFCQQVINN
ncbi:hypothetical protein [Salinisphaera sp. G21_0]|uniref:hypothetical protein n=1 Tax=Salinisphaera sp. G21_0 TaxID=2821094 RepID=UPI001ADB65E1|nr:hypothetical protein [Salinisphaera sp. G21_0]MBO9480774.1 hypothetical protein [Salinisphaera sp. G21_0]